MVIDGYTYKDYENAYGKTGVSAEFAYIVRTKEHADNYVLEDMVV